MYCNSHSATTRRTIHACGTLPSRALEWKTATVERATIIPTTARYYFVCVPVLKSLGWGGGFASTYKQAEHGVINDIITTTCKAVFSNEAFQPPTTLLGQEAGANVLCPQSIAPAPHLSSKIHESGCVPLDERGQPATLEKQVCHTPQADGPKNKSRGRSKHDERVVSKMSSMADISV